VAASARQTSEPAGAEAQYPGVELRRPAELIERDAEQSVPRNPPPKPTQEYSPIVAPLCRGTATARTPEGEMEKVPFTIEAGDHGQA